MAKVLVAMSGGVDSSLVAQLLKDQGHTCIGATMTLYSSEEEGRCGGRADVEDARALAKSLGMDHHVLNYEDDFGRQVIEPFIAAYERGWTPNPCLACNRHFKFGALYDLAKDLGCDYIATGHYAQVVYNEDRGFYELKKGEDPKKDQSYVLYSLDQDKLAHTLFPLHGLSKDQVRDLAQAKGLLTANKKDSQDICFVRDGDYVAFMEAYGQRAYPQGDLLDEAGNKLGCHQGAVSYTIGQRKGLGVALGYPAYVVDKDMEKNQVVVGPESSLYSQSLLAEDWNWTSVDSLEEPIRAQVKTRYQQEESPALVTPLGGGRVRIDFDQGQRALAKGQAAVAYIGDVVLGGGLISQVYK
ncbi:MAG: tRNA 2-thiouridine(34) synthase MnmA [Tissierellia bacterium]|nr:tRNA 2-thiouridine(34) synthase MnmA [Tissierellia bacterium]